jgi:hypothetical protein
MVPPVIAASSGNGQVVVATPGSYTTMTCSTTGSADVVSKPSKDSLAAYPGDTIRFTVPAGWRFVRWEGSHAPLHGTGTGGLWPPIHLEPEPELDDRRVVIADKHHRQAYDLLPASRPFGEL